MEAAIDKFFALLSVMTEWASTTATVPFVLFDVPIVVITLVVIAVGMTILMRVFETRVSMRYPWDNRGAKAFSVLLTLYLPFIAAIFFVNAFGLLGFFGAQFV